MAKQKGDAYSVDLRQRVLNAMESHGWNAEEGAEFFSIGIATIYRWLRLRRETGSIAPRPHGGGQPRKVLPEHDAVLRRIVEEKNDRTLAEIRTRLAERTGLLVSDTAICDALRRLGLTLKKKTLTAIERERADVVERRRTFTEEMKSLDPEKLVFLDEAGSTIAMTRTRARAPKGERAQGKVPRSRGVVTTIIGALTLAGLSVLMTIEGATTGAVFTAFAHEVLAPTLQRDSVVVLDNLAAHRVKGVREAIESTGSRLLYLPPYSPDLNPIEESWSKLKAHLRAQEPRSIQQLDASVADAANHITSEDAAGWIRHAGYHVKG